jgi:hypothetical protein
MRSARSLSHLALSLVWLLGCNRGYGCGERPLAELSEARGAVARDFRGRETQWLAAQVGARFSWGDGLHTASGATAQLRVGETGRVMVESDTIIRFLAKPAASQATPAGLQIAQGSAIIEASDGDLSIQTRNGTALLKLGTRIELRPAPQGDSYRVMMGSAEFSQLDGSSQNVRAGQSVAIGIGLAVFDDALAQPKDAGSLAPAAPPSIADAGSSAPDASIDTPAAQANLKPAAQLQAVEAAEPGMQRASDLVVPLGESFQLYDPRPPTRVGFEVAARCVGDAELIVDHAAAVRGSGELAADVAAGSHKYSVRCLQRDAPRGLVRGSFRVVRSDGARPLPKTAPRDAIDLDGHKYRLMYQNLRPALYVTWPEPAKATAYVLTVESPTGKARTFQTPTPSYTIESSAMADGRHVLLMAAADNAKLHSKATVVEIEFDDAAPTASIELPPAAGFDPGEPIAIRGSAIEDSRVSAEGEAVSVDRKHWFSHTLTLPPGKPALAIRIQHPAHGVRYYLRRPVAARR